MAKLDYDYVESVVDYFNRNSSTVRKTANHFGISRTRVHYYLTKVMPNATSSEILKKNKDQCHIRGGEATRQKYLNMRHIGNE